MVIILDMGGVLMNLNVAGCWERMEQLLGKEQMQQVLGLQSNAEGRADSLFDLYERGMVDTDTFLDTLMQHAREGARREDFVNAWNSMHGGIPEERLALIRRWRDAGHHLYMLSNNNDLHWQDVHARYDLSMFRYCYASHLLHLSKPDIRIYQTVDAEIRKAEGMVDAEIGKTEEMVDAEIRKAEEAYKEEIQKQGGENDVFCFVDDLEANRLAAQQLGWRTFSSLDELQAVLF